MRKKTTAIHESVDDIPVIIALLLQMRVAALIDKHFPTNGNRTGLSLGQMCVIWLTVILSQADHRLKQVQLWVAEHQTTLSRCLGRGVEPRDGTDDRLATGLDYLSVGENWRAFAADLNGTLMRVYDLKTKQTRIDTPTASAYVSPEGMFQFGHSKDHRPDLPQLKIAMSTLDPLGLPLTTPVLAGQSADDPLYTPEIDSSHESIGHSGLTHLGECKMASLKTRADSVGRKDYYLCPLSAVQMPATELDRLLAPVFAEKQPLVAVYLLPTGDSTPRTPTPDARIAVGFAYPGIVSGKEQTGKTLRWNERRLVGRRLNLAARQEKALHKRLRSALAEIAALNERKQGKARLTSVEQAQEATTRIAEAHHVQELLQSEVHREEQKRHLRRYGARAATTVREELLTVQATVDQQAVEQTVRRFGWRVYGTNQEASDLPLEKAV